jgi:uncharacterized protein with NAD-binding domain and iron-sulfur cluster
VTTPDADASPDVNHGDLTHLGELTEEAAFEQLEGKIGSSEILGIRYWQSVDGQQAPAPLDAGCIFQNTKRFPYHYPFLSHFPELSAITFDDYTKMIMGIERVWWAGILRRYATVAHPRHGQQGVIAYQIWQDTDERLSVAQLVEVDRRFKKCIAYASDRLVLVPEAPQVEHFQELQADLEQQEVDLLFPSSLPGSS